jgi:hypothetical protein
MIEVDNPIYEFGEVLEGVFVIHAFVLTNMGDEPLTITRVTTSCGCTTTNLAKTTLARGESVELGAILDTVGYGGRTITKLITVESNDPKDAKPTLQLKGVVERAQSYNIAAGDLNYLFYVLIDLRNPEDYTTAHLMGEIYKNKGALRRFARLLQAGVGRQKL